MTTDDLTTTSPGDVPENGDDRPVSRPATAARRRQATTRRRRIIAGAVAGVVVLSAGAAGAYAIGSGGPDYRTAEAQSGSVVQTAAGTGTVAAVSQDAASFQVDGTVATVDVAVGDTVAAGQTLATLDPTDLDEAVTAAQQAVADAEDALETDLEAQSGTSSGSSPSTGSTGSGSSGSSSAASTSGGSSGSNGAAGSSGAAGSADSSGSGSGAGDGSGSGSGSGSSEQVQAALAAVNAARETVTAAQQALLDQYDVVAAALASSESDLAASNAACAEFLAATFPTSGTGGAGSSTGEETEGDEGSSGSGSSDDAARSAELVAIQDALRTCQASISSAQGGQSSVNSAQIDLVSRAATLNDAVAALDEALRAWQEAAQSSGAPSTGGSTGTDGGSTGGGSTGDVTGGDSTGSGSTGTGLSGSGSAGSSSTGSGSSDGSAPSGGTSGSGGMSSATVTAETILADKAAIALAEAELAIAEQERTAATLTSTIAGTVVSVDAAVGDAVTTGQTVVTVDGPDGFLVTMTMPLSTIKAMSVGDEATISATSTEEELTGAVSLIGVTNVSSTSDPSFQVTLTVDQKDATLFDGASVNVEITVARSDDVVTIPTSAVHVSGTSATVQLLDGGEVTEAPVTLGAVGAETSEIAEGLAVGQRVVLADLSEDVVSDSSNNSSSSFSFSGGSGLSGSSSQMPAGGPPDGISVQVVPGG